MPAASVVLAVRDVAQRRQPTPGAWCRRYAAGQLPASPRVTMYSTVSHDTSKLGRFGYMLVADPDYVLALYPYPYP